MQVLAEPLLADVHQVFAREGRGAAGRGIGAGENDAQKLGLSSHVSLGGRPLPQRSLSPSRPYSL